MIKINEYNRKNSARQRSAASTILNVGSRCNTAAVAICGLLHELAVELSERSKKQLVVGGDKLFAFIRIAKLVNLGLAYFRPPGARRVVKWLK